MNRSTAPEIPAHHVTEAERSDRPLPEDRVQALVSQFAEAGCLHLKGLFPEIQIKRWRDAFQRRYRSLMNDGIEPTSAQRVGDRRWMVPLKLAGPFGAPAFYGNRLLLSLMEAVLGGEYLLHSAGAVVALPGAAAQHDHRDLPALFDDQPVDWALPPYAITVMLPLIDCHREQGTTQMRPGSHAVSVAKAKEMPIATPDIPAGSCILVDYRLQHGGTPNPSQRARPLLYLVYTRPWFRDYRNFKQHPPLLVSAATWRRASVEHRRLLETARRTLW